MQPNRRQPTRLPCSGILQARTLEWVAISFSNAWKWKSESEIAQSCPTLCNPMDCSLPGSSVHEIFQARVLEWGAIAFSNIRFWIKSKWLTITREALTDMVPPVLTQLKLVVLQIYSLCGSKNFPYLSLWEDHNFHVLGDPMWPGHLSHDRWECPLDILSLLLLSFCLFFSVHKMLLSFQSCFICGFLCIVLVAYSFSRPSHGQLINQTS